MLMIISKWLDCVGQNHHDMKRCIFTVRFWMQDCDYNSVVLQFCTFHTCIIKAESYLSSTATAAPSAGDPYPAAPSASSRLSDLSFVLLVIKCCFFFFFLIFSSVSWWCDTSFSEMMLRRMLKKKNQILRFRSHRLTFLQDHLHVSFTSQSTYM